MLPDFSGEMRTIGRLLVDMLPELESTSHSNSFSLITLLVGDETQIQPG
jgi:hypothetical protein